MNVVIVESAAKAKTINKYLGSSYKVIASFGTPLSKDETSLPFPATRSTRVLKEPIVC